MKHAKVNNTGRDRIIVRVPITRTVRIDAAKLDEIRAWQLKTFGTSNQ